MALYDNFLNKNNLYSRPASMMSDVNDYLGANKASLPMNQDSLGSMMGKPMLGGINDIGGAGGAGNLFDPLKDRDDELGGDPKDPPKDPKDPPKDTTGYAGNNSLLTKFIGDLGVLDENQQGLLLDFITGGGVSGDAARGVSPEEYAQLFNVSSDYTGRFQGFPQLASISDDISNVFNYRSEQRGFEQRAVQQAQIQGGKFQGGMGFSGFGKGKGMSNALQRRQMQDTLRQRQGAVDEAAAGKYGTLLSSLQSAIRSGFSTAGTIHTENPEAVWGFERSGQFTPEGWTEDDGYGDFTDKYGTIWENIGGQWRQQDR
jgi:hypothetical protein